MQQSCWWSPRNQLSSYSRGTFPIRLWWEEPLIVRMSASSTQHGNNASCKDFSADLHLGTRGWYFSKDEIDNHSPSRKDGIDRTRESSLRKSYCSFLKDFGMKLRV